MKRNVLYRGKTAWNTWTEGFYVYDKTLDQHMIWSGAGFIEVDGNTISQFTGLPFKIFEGDIIKPKKFETPYVVFWNEENCCFSIIDKYQYQILKGSDEVFKTSILQNKLNVHPRWILENEVEPIGNIYDNPELLK